MFRITAVIGIGYVVKKSKYVSNNELIIVQEPIKFHITHYTGIDCQPTITIK